MKKASRVLTALLAVLFLMTLLPFPSSADTGPKAAVHILFEGELTSPCYATLLSKTPSTGPQSVWDGDPEHRGDLTLPDEVFFAMAEYEDTDGFYFLQIAGEISESRRFTWGYYPPEIFKVLLYFPEGDVFAVSEVCERYAFDTYYTVTLSDGLADAEYDDERSTDERIDAYRSYQLGYELLTLLIRMAVTVTVELLVALILGVRGGRALLLITGANVLTQLLLNLALAASGVYGDTLALLYLFLELLVFVIEAILYARLLPRYDQNDHGRFYYVLLAGLSNLASVIAGVLLLAVLPGVL